MTERFLANTSAGRRRDYGLLVAARGISTFGAGIGPVALAFGLLTLPGGGPIALSLVLTSHAVPQLLLVLIAGTLADRLPRPRLLVAAESVAGVAWAAIGIMLVTSAAPTVVLAGGAALAGIAAAVVGPALTGLVPDIVPAERLRSANSTLKTATHAARLAGFAAAGPTVALIGPGYALLINAGTFLVAAALAACLQPSRPVAPSDSGMVRDLRDGWREFSSRQWLWVLVSAYSFNYAVVTAVTGVLGPLAARAYLGGATAWSLILTAQGMGTVVGAVGARWVDPARPALAATALFPTLAVPMMLMAGATPLSLVVLGAGAGGVAAGLVSVLATTVMQQRVPAAALSRVSAYDWLGSLALTPLALALAGPAAEAFGLRLTLAACGVIVLIASIAAIGAPQVRALRRFDSSRQQTNLAVLATENPRGPQPAR
ncbi:MFS transporter [Micromonospora sp. NPDC094482]|uniref:MFS transporter n=1 Tax=unclassified Micromonospora TaxID=2617518 RepID=UPI00332BFE27